MMLILLALPALAEESDPPAFTPVLQVRPRMESDMGRDGAPGGDKMQVLQRTRLGARMSFDAWSFAVIGQDARVWGSETRPNQVSNGTFDIRVGQATYAKGAHTFDVGRQELVLHEQRILAKSRWVNQGRAYDGVRYRHISDVPAVYADLMAVRTADPFSDTWEGQGFITQASVGWGTATDYLVALYLMDHLEDAGRTRHTAGYYGQKRGKVFGFSEAYIQVGPDGGQQTMAWMASVVGGYAFDHPLKPKIRVGYDGLSGDADPNDGIDGSFDTLTGAKHKFYGLSDVMHKTFAGGADGQGLHNPFIRADLQVGKVGLRADGHLFFADKPLADPFIGTEVDLIASWQIRKELRIQSGASLVVFGSDELAVEGFGWLVLDARFGNP